MNLTQAELSDLLTDDEVHINRAGISKIENGARLVTDREL